MTRRELMRRGVLISPVIAGASCSTLANLAVGQYLISPTQILAKLLPFFPFQQQLSGVGQMSLANPVFSMAPDINKVRVGLTANLATASGLGELTGIPALGRIAGKGTSGTTQLACGLRYDPETRGIFLKEPEIEKLDFQGLSSSLTEPARQVVNRFGPGLLDRHPIHTLDPSLATRFLNSMTVKDGGIALGFSPLA